MPTEQSTDIINAASILQAGINRLYELMPEIEDGEDMLYAVKALEELTARTDSLITEGNYDEFNTAINDALVEARAALLAATDAFNGIKTMHDTVVTKAGETHNDRLEVESLLSGLQDAIAAASLALIDGENGLVANVTAALKVIQDDVKANRDAVDSKYDATVAKYNATVDKYNATVVKHDAVIAAASGLDVLKRSFIDLAQSGTLPSWSVWIIDSSAASTRALPASPTDGDEISIRDGKGLCGTNNATITGRLSFPTGTQTSLTITTNFSWTKLKYHKATNLWYAIEGDA